MDRGLKLSGARSSGLVLVALAWAAFLMILGSPEALLFTVPVFLLAAPLAFGRYPGGNLIDAFVARRRLPRAVPELSPVVVFETFVRQVEAVRIPGRSPPVAVQ
jgi:hypothetical protein